MPHRLTPFIKPLLLSCAFALTVPAIAGRLGQIEGGKSQLFYLALLGITWAGLIGAAYIRAVWGRTLWACLLSVGYMTLTVFHHASGQFMSYDAFINMVYSAGFADDALRQNQAAFIAAGWRTALLAAAIMWSPGIGKEAAGSLHRWTLPGPLAWTLRQITFLAPLAALSLVTALLFLRGGDGGRTIAPGFTGTAYAALALYENNSDAYGPRQDPIAAPIAPPKVRNLVLIVDESIAANYLAINDPRGVRTPLSSPPAGVLAHNFGVAAAITGCSVGANQTLRYGGTRADYRAINASYASIWAYAQQAGMETIYIDAQRENGALQNLMNAQERAQIDRFVQFGGVPVAERDIRVAETIAVLMADPKPKFIMVNKVGAHFPVHDKYPDAAMLHTPALPRGRYLDISDTGDRSGFDGTARDWQLYRNAYRNTLEWNVGHFFERLFAEADLSDALIMYTADHGQTLHEQGQPGTTTHCSADPLPDEGAVPLVMIEGLRDGLGDGEQFGASGLPIAAMAEQNRSKSSAYMIFPTLLSVMGYDREAVERTYGRSLLRPARDPMTFNTRFNARLNLGPRWKKVDPEALARPPADDGLPDQ